MIKGLGNTLNLKVSHNPFQDGEIETYQSTNPAQQEIWTTLSLLPETTLCYNECLVLNWKTSVNVNLLQRAFIELVYKHPALRSTLTPDGQIQMFHKLTSQNERSFQIQVIPTNSAAETASALQQQANADVAYAFPLTNGAPVRLTAISENGQCTASILTFHHIICDGESAYLLIRDLSQIYEALLTNSYTRSASVQPAPFTKATPEAVTYWKKELQNIATAKTFKHLENKNRGLFRSFESNRLDVTLNSIISRGLQTAARKNRVSLFSFLLTAFKVTLAKQNQQNEVTLGICTSSQAENANSVGHRVIVRPMKSTIADGSYFNENLKKIDGQLMELLEAPTIGYGELVSLITNRSVETGTSPLFSIVFNFDQSTGLPQLVNSVKTYPRTHENFELFVNTALTLNGEITFEVQYNKEIFTTVDVTHLFNQFQTDLENVIHNNTHVHIESQTHRTPAQIIPLAAAKPVEVQQPAVAADDQILSTVIAIWQRRLKSNSLTSTSHFFNSGGHSILALEIAKELATSFGVTFTIKDIFVNPTPAKQAQALTKLIGSTQPVAIEKVIAKTESLPVHDFKVASEDLTVAQQQAMFVERSQDVGALHNLPACLKVQGPVDTEQLRSALATIIANNDALRTYFKSEQGRILRKIAEPKTALSFKLEEIKSTKAEIVALLQQNAKESFDLSVWPLMNVKLCRTNCGETLLYFNFHHIIWDGWSFDLFFEELNKHYVGIQYFPQTEDTKLNNSYSNFAVNEQAYLKSSAGQADRDFWKKAYAETITRLQLPTLTNIPENAGSSASAFELNFAEGTKEKLAQYAKNNSVSIYSVLLTSFKIALAKYAQNKDIIVGIPVQNRTNDTYKKTFGYFVNTIPLRSQIDVNKTFKELLSEVQSNFLEAYSHQQLPFFEIKRLVPEESRNDFMPALFSFQETSQRKSVFNNEPYSQINLNNNASHTPLDMWIKYSNNKMEGALQYKDQLFSRSFIENFVDLYMHVLDTALANSDKNQNAIALSKKQKDTLIEWGHGEDKANTVTLLEYFQSAVAQNPTKIATSCESNSLTYTELDALSDRIAAKLNLYKTNRPLKVGVCLERTAQLPAVLMAIFKCGFTYIPLDHTFPTERLNYIVADSELDILITEKNLSYRPIRHETKINYLSQLTEKSNLSFRAKLQSEDELAHTAYILYTSGTTGTPKGVSVSYDALQNFVLAMQGMGIINQKDKALAHTTICFDISFLEILVPILTGASVHMVNKTDILEGDGLNAIIEKYGINFIQATPSAWKILMAQNWKPASKNMAILSGGERLPQEVGEYLQECSNAVYNMYGPTETTIWSSFQNLQKNNPITCGTPIYNTQFLVLSASGEVLPPHASGELYIGGLGLSGGYYRKNDLTEQKFKLITTHTMSGVFYATGDLARWNTYGEIEILGRNDRQVKINGFRLELFEIESHIRKMQMFKDVHVFVLTDGDYQKIVAALVLEPGKSTTAESVRNELNQHLPLYMLPQDYIFLNEIPRTTSQKADENELCFLVKKNANTPAALPVVVQKTVPTINVNEKIRELWCDHLNLSSIQENRSFFELGGHSLIALNLTTQLEDLLKIKIPIRFLVESKNFNEFCDKVGSLNKNSDADSKALLVLKPGHEKRNSLFCFHAVLGNAFNYSFISNFINSDHYLVGFQDVALNGVSPMKNSVEEMAAEYVKELLEFQPVGPYSLCGYSMGGTIAFEAAQQLVEKGHQVDKLIVYDTFGPGINLRGWTLEKLMTVIARRLKRKPKIQQPTLIDQIGDHNYNIWLNYKAKPFNGNLSIIRGKKTWLGWRSDPYIGWKSFIKGHIEVREINAPHNKFIEDPSFQTAFIQLYNSKKS